MTIMPHIMAKPLIVFAKGTHFEFTFIPYRPDITVGIAIMRVMTVRDFMTLFSLLSITELISSLVPFIMSR